MNLINQIKPLSREKWQDYQLAFRYTSHHYYDVEINRMADGFNVSFEKKPFDVPYEQMAYDIWKCLVHCKYIALEVLPCL